jgi:hypothetical protein
MALRLAIRLCSLFETNQRFFLASRSTPDRSVFFPNRRNKLSGDSPALNTTLVIK